jgi:hypothetical protein
MSRSRGAAGAKARGSTDQASRQLESIIGWNRRDRVWHVWHRLCAAAEEMNYAVRRTVELQMRLPR